MSPALRASRESAAVFLLEGRTHIAITGKDRARFLHSFCTNDIKSLGIGQGCEAFVCNAKGHVLGHITVFIAEDWIWLDTVPAVGQKLIAHFDRYILSEDVQLQDFTRSNWQLHFVGPGAAELLANLYKSAGSVQSLLQSAPVPGIAIFPEAPSGICCVDWFGMRSYLIGLGRISSVKVDGMPVPFGADDDRSALASRGFNIGTAADWEALRIDAGFPAYGVDITEDNLPQEVARNVRCISFTKGCYLGQEPVARIDALGHTNRELRRLHITSATIPANGTDLLDSASSQVVGKITSASPNPFGDGVVALGYVKSKWLAAGTRLRLANDAAGEVTVR